MAELGKHCFMLAKRNRLKNKKDLENVFKKGENFKEDFLILKVVPNSLNLIRFGFIVSPKISKKATLRNKIKRRLSQLIGLKLEKLKKGIDAIFIALPGIEKKDFWEIEETIEKIFDKAKIFKPKTKNEKPKTHT